jgi:hypothetical protein
MKIGQPVETFTKQHQRATKYAAVYAAAAQLVNGTYLPVEMDSVADARRLAMCIRASVKRSQQFTATARGTVVYIGRRHEESQS